MHDPQVLIVGGASPASRLEGLSSRAGSAPRSSSGRQLFRWRALALYLPGNGVRAIAALGLADAFGGSVRLTSGF